MLVWASDIDINSISSSTSISILEGDWGKTGHRATGEIASKHLSRKAKKKISKLLDGQSLAEISIYADEIKSDSKYRKYNPWHYVNIPFDKRYDEIEKASKGDLIVAIETCISILEDDTKSNEHAFYLKLLVHFIGDLHQPLHTGRAEDKGGNDIQVRWFDKGTNLHRLWDTELIEFYNMSYSELAANRKKLSKKEIKNIQSGTLMDWVYESRELSKTVYASAQVGEKLSYDYAYIHLPIVRDQLQKSGLRMAKVLNDIFG